MRRFAVIMAGGVGARLWPLSREKKPKQFIRADGDACMLVNTIRRISDIVPPKQCFIITNQQLVDITKEAVGELIPHDNIIAEPSRKNTAACIAYAALRIKKTGNNGVFGFIPADGYVKDTVNYKNTLLHAYEVAETTKSLTIAGVEPTYPATGYGYIQAVIENEEEKAGKVRKFIEKPDLENAKTMVSSKQYFWNSGMVFGHLDVIIDKIKKELPSHYESLKKAMQVFGKDIFLSYIKQAYDKLDPISFDVGVLEKCTDCYMVKGSFEWDDLGSIDALSKTLTKDASSNFVKGEHVGIDTTNAVIYSDDLLIATIGLKDMIVAGDKDAVIVCPRNRAQDIKILVEKLKQKGYDNYL